MAFQIFDDILDITGAPAVTGKRRGADLRDGTVTLPMIYAIQAEPELAGVMPGLGADDGDRGALRPPGRAQGRRAFPGARPRIRRRGAGRAEGPVDGADIRALTLVADGVVDRYA